MIESHGLANTKRSSKRQKLVFVGVIMFVASIVELGVSPWLALPPWLVLVSAFMFFSSGVFVALGQRGLNTSVRVKPIPLSKMHTDHLEKWFRSGELAIVMERLSQGQTLHLGETVGKLFGSYVLMTWTDRKGRIRAEKAHRVGMKFLPTGNENGQPVFTAGMYRRDIAAQNGIERPWRRITRGKTKIHYFYPSPLIELPAWVA